MKHIRKKLQVTNKKLRVLPLENLYEVRSSIQLSSSSESINSRKMQ